MRSDNSYVYFVHSYYLQAENENDVAATTDYITHIHASVEHGNIFACQFHPEKSSDVGLRILKNFVELSLPPWARVRPADCIVWMCTMGAW